MNKEKVGIGVIGCGTIASVYLKNIMQHYNNLELLAVSDIYIEKAQEMAQKYGVPKACSTEELLAMDEVEIVLNLTTPGVHYLINKKILNAGKHVYCEKPLTLSLEDGKQLVNLAKQKKLLCVSAPDTFLGSGGQTVRKLLDNGVIGMPIGFTANMCCPGHELWHPAPGFYYKEGAGPMFDMGPYYMTMLVSLLGPVKKVSAYTSSGRPIREIQGTLVRSEVPTTYTGIMEMACGAVGTVTMSFDIWNANLPCLEIYGTEGTVEVPDPNNFSGVIHVFNGNELKSIVEETEGDHSAKLMTMIEKQTVCRKEYPLEYPADNDLQCNMRGLGVSEMAQALLTQRKARLSSELSLHVVEILNAFEISARSGEVYEMTTGCERPDPLEEGLALWEIS